MKVVRFVRLAATICALVVAGAASAQIGSGAEEARNAVTEDVAPGVVIKTTTGKDKKIEEGETVLVNGQKTVVTKDKPLRVKASDEVKTLDGETLQVGKNRYFAVAFYPLAVFTYAGALGDQPGGTLSTTGQLIAADVGFRRKRGAVELGGWYFHTSKKGTKDLYQVQARTFLKPEFGVQLAYINISDGTAPSYTGFLIYNLSSASAGQRPKHPWSFQIGGGAYWNVSKEIRPTAGAGGTTFPLVPRSTSNFTSFVSGSVGLNKSMNLSFGQWYLRDRNADINRFTLGVSFSL